jgi:hypothetical protein
MGACEECHVERTKFVAAVALLLISHSALAVYKCKDASGRTIYSDTKCPSQQIDAQMQWAPGSEVNVVKGDSPTSSYKGVPQRKLPDLTGHPAERLAKATKALQDMHSSAVDCRRAYDTGMAQSTRIKFCDNAVSYASWSAPIAETIAGVRTQGGARTSDLALADYLTEQLATELREAARLGKALLSR